MMDATGGRDGAPLDRVSLDAACARLYDHRDRLVGWGSGSVFDYFHALHPVRLDYLVDNDERRWGQRARGIDIVPPARLLADGSAATLVVIYSSAWPAIAEQIAQWGGYATVPASTAFADAAARHRLAWADALCRATPERAPSSTDAIVVQGPILPGVTRRVLHATAVLHPHVRIVLSTWDDTDPSQLAAVRPLVDEVVLNERPAVAGVQNRNLQIVSTRSGIARAMSAGARMLLKIRTDTSVLAPGIFERARRHLARFDATAARAVGLRDRLMVPATYTRLLMRYHPADLVMLGHAEDLALFWSAPLDTRTASPFVGSALDTTVSSLNADGHPAESYLGLAFNRALGRTPDDGLQDSWNFYRDLFAVVDNDWFDLLWYKNLTIPDAHDRVGPRRLVSQAFWERLASHDPRLPGEAAALDQRDVTLRHWVSGTA